MKNIYKNKLVVLILLVCCVKQNIVVAKDKDKAKNKKADIEKDQSWVRWAIKNRYIIGPIIGSLLAVGKFTYDRSRNNGLGTNLNNQGNATSSINQSVSVAQPSSVTSNTSLGQTSSPLTSNQNIKNKNIANVYKLKAFQDNFPYKVQVDTLINEHDFENNFIKIFGVNEKDNIFLAILAKNIFESNGKNWDIVKNIAHALKLNFKNDHDEVDGILKEIWAHDFVWSYGENRTLIRENSRMDLVDTVLRQDLGNKRLIELTDKLRNLEKQYNEKNNNKFAKIFVSSELKNELYLKIKEKLDKKEDILLRDALDSGLEEILINEIKKLENK